MLQPGLFNPIKSLTLMPPTTATLIADYFGIVTGPERMAALHVAGLLMRRNFD
jgi:hypothetical protein